MSERKTIHTIHIDASISSVYKALLDKDLIVKWKVPDNMRCYIHEYNAIENGRIRISLAYNNINEMGKTIQNIDTYHGYFHKLRPFSEIIEIDEFESNMDEMRGLMTITYTLIESNGRTDLMIVHGNIPIGISLNDNALGWGMALTKLAKLIENDK